MNLKWYFCKKIIIMFSTGQLIFAVFFVIAFVSIMVYTYRKDLKLHKIHYNGTSKWVFIAFISFVIILFGLKTFLKN